MADKKISQLTSASTPLAGSEVLPVVQGGSTVKVSVNDLTAGKSVSASNFVATGATVPANGMFLGAANTLSFSSNNTEHWNIDSSGNLTPKATETIGSFITAPVTHIYAKQFTASKTAGTDQIRVTSGDAAGSLASPINLDVTFLGYDNRLRARIRARDATSNTDSSPLTFSNHNALSFVDTLQLTTANDVSALVGNFVLNTAGKGITFTGDGGAIWRAGTGSPEGVVTAPPGSLYTNISGGAGTTLYVKESGAGNTGWVAK